MDLDFDLDAEPLLEELAEPELLEALEDLDDDPLLDDECDLLPDELSLPLLPELLSRPLEPFLFFSALLLLAGDIFAFNNNQQ